MGNLRALIRITTIVAFHDHLQYTHIQPGNSEAAGGIQICRD